MKATAFDAIARDLGTASTRRGIFRLLAGAAAAGSGVALLVDDDIEARGKGKGKSKRRGKGRDHGRDRDQARVDAQGKHKGKKKKKKSCPPCQKRKKGKCKGRLPDGASCPGGTCQGGRCMTASAPSGAHFSVSGRSILDAAGNPVLLRGVNKMSVFDDDDPTGAISFPEIRKTGANTVRIVWAITKDLTKNGPATDPAVLDALITNARANQLVPMIELHDATGAWGRLDDLVAYWTRPAIVDIITKHQEYLLVNIGNEVGDENVSDGQFVNGYTNAVQRMRGAGIHTPLVIDAPEWGKKLTTLNATAATLLSADPDHNLIFSVHMYWGKAAGADAQFIRTALQDAANANYPLIIGEFSQFGAQPPAGNDICGPAGEIDYRVILEESQKLAIGWYAWEWGPGNGFFDPKCAVMDMTPDRTFASLKPGWALEVATTSPFSIKNTAQSIL